MKRGRFGIGGSGWSFVLPVFVLSRLFFLGVGAAAAALLPHSVPLNEPYEPPGFLNYWAHWDGTWYSEIATGGYEARAPASTAFFPIFPMIVRVGSAIGGGPALWGVLVSTIATLFATYFLYRVAEKLLDERAAKATVLVFAFFPVAFFLNAVYTEALFLAFTAGSFWAAYVRRDLFLAGLLGAFAAATRNFGVLLLIPLLYEWLRNRREFGRRGLLEIALVPAGLLGYVAFLWARFGDPLSFASVQAVYWGRELGNPVTTLDTAWDAAREGMNYVLDPAALFFDPSPLPALGASDVTNVAFLALFLVCIGIGLVLLPPGLSAYAFLVALLPLATPSPFYPLLGLPRYVLAAFPLFFVLGYLLSRSRLALVLWLILSAGAGVALTALFVTWRFVA